MGESDMRPAMTIAAGMPLIVIGALVGKSDAVVFGLSAQFWAGFMISVGLCGMLASVFFATWTGARR